MAGLPPALKRWLHGLACIACVLRVNVAGTQPLAARGHSHLRHVKLNVSSKKGSSSTWVVTHIKLCVNLMTSKGRNDNTFLNLPGIPAPHHTLPAVSRQRQREKSLSMVHRQRGRLTRRQRDRESDRETTHAPLAETCVWRGPMCTRCRHHPQTQARQGFQPPLPAGPLNG